MFRVVLFSVLVAALGCKDASSTSVTSAPPTAAQPVESKPPEPVKKEPEKPVPSYVYPPIKSVQAVNVRATVCANEDVLDLYLDDIVNVKKDNPAIARYILADMLYHIEKGTRVRIEKHHEKKRQCYVFILDGRYASKRGWVNSDSCNGHEANEKKD